MITFSALFTEFPGKNASEKIRKTEITSLTNISRKKRNSFFYAKCPQVVSMGKPYPENGFRYWRVDCSLGFNHFLRKKAVPWTILIYPPHPCWIFSRWGYPADSSQSPYVLQHWRINSSEFFSLNMILFYCCPKPYSMDILYTRSSLDASLL